MSSTKQQLIFDSDDQSSIRVMAGRFAAIGNDLPFVPVRPYEHRWLQLAWRALLLVSLSIIVFYATLGDKTLWDEGRVVQDFALRSASGIGAIWSNPFDQASPPSIRTINWLVGRMFGVGISPIRLVTLFFHALTVVMVWFTLRRLNVAAAWLAVAVLAVHPAVMPTVSWISRQSDVVGAACSAIALWSYLRAREIRPPLDETIWTDPNYHVDDEVRVKWPWFIFGLASLVGLGSGSVAAVIAPACLLVIDRQSCEHCPSKSLTTLLATLTLCGLVSAWWYAAMPVPQKVECTLAIGGTIAHLLVPLPLPFAFDRIDVPVIWTTISFGVAAAWIGFGFVRASRPEGCFLLIGAALAMCHGLLARSPDAGAVALADIVAYPALIVMVPIVVAAIVFASTRHLASSGALAVRWLLGLALIVGLGTISVNRAPAYAGGDAIWQQALAIDPDGVFARQQLAARFLVQGYLEEAAIQLDRVPDERRNVSWQLVRGRTFEAQKRYIEAAACYETAQQMDPSNTTILISLAEARSNAGQPEQAAQLYLKALERTPNDAGLYINAGLIQMRLGRLREAADLYERALNIDPLFLPAHINLANAFFDLGQYEESAKHLQEAVRIDPRNFAAFMNAGILLYRLKDHAKAERMFRAAVNLDSTSPDAFDNLGVVMAAQGKLSDAAWSFTQATRLDSNHAAAAHLAEVRQMLRSQAATQPTR